MLINLVFLLGAFMETFALQWTSSSTFPNGTRVNVCLGDNVTLPWRFDLMPSEHIIDIEWYQTYQNREIPLAGYFGERFMSYADLGRTLHFVPNAGLQFSGVKPSDMGEYSVLVNLNGDQASSQTAFLHEPEAPVTISGDLHAYILPDAQFPVINGESHVQLACGHFRSLGEPPITVTWRTPSGQFLNSSYNNGTFVVTLSRPIEGGNYSCQVTGTATAERCLQNNYLFRTVSTVHVDYDNLTLALQRNDIERLQEDSFRQAEEIARLKFDLLDSSNRPNSCLDVRNYDDDSGVHTIYPICSRPVRVYCDQSTDGGGWTVIQRRENGSVDFYRNWHEYESGFGNPESEYWIGLSNLNVMTSSRSAILRVELTDFSGNTAYAVFNTFYISGPEDNYRLQIGGYHGTAGNSFETANNTQFSTYDREHDVYSTNCAANYHGAWWYYSCSWANLNGRYYPSEVTNVDGIWWYTWHNHQSLKRVEMKIWV